MVCAQLKAMLRKHRLMFQREWKSYLFYSLFMWGYMFYALSSSSAQVRGCRCNNCATFCDIKRQVCPDRPRTTMPCQDTQENEAVVSSIVACEQGDTPPVSMELSASGTVDAPIAQLLPYDTPLLPGGAAAGIPVCGTTTRREQDIKSCLSSAMTLRQEHPLTGTFAHTDTLW